MDKISIITTFYNAENFIARSVQSILLQKTDGFKIEYILVNDHSPDHSLDMVKRLCEHNGNTNIEVKIIKPEEMIKYIEKIRLKLKDMFKAFTIGSLLT